MFYSCKIGFWISVVGGLGLKFFPLEAIGNEMSGLLTQEAGFASWVLASWALSPFLGRRASIVGGPTIVVVVIAGAIPAGVATLIPSTALVWWIIAVLRAVIGSPKGVSPPVSPGTDFFYPLGKFLHFLYLLR